jgi:hypothetical protein
VDSSAIEEEEDDDDVSHIQSVVHRLVLPSIKTLGSNFLSFYVSDTQLRTTCIGSQLTLVHNLCKGTVRKETTKCSSFCLHLRWDIKCIKKTNKCTGVLLI